MDIYLQYMGVCPTSKNKHMVIAKICNKTCGAYAHIADRPCQHYDAVKSSIPIWTCIGTPTPDEPRREHYTVNFFKSIINTIFLKIFH